MRFTDSIDEHGITYRGEIRILSSIRTKQYSIIKENVSTYVWAYIHLLLDYPPPTTVQSTNETSPPDLHPSLEPMHKLSALCTPSQTDAR